MTTRKGSATPGSATGSIGAAALGGEHPHAAKEEDGYSSTSKSLADEHVFDRSTSQRSRAHCQHRDTLTAGGSSPELAGRCGGAEERAEDQSNSKGDPLRRDHGRRHQLCGDLREDGDAVSTEGLMSTSTRQDELSVSQAKHLEERALSIVPELFQGLSV